MNCEGFGRKMVWPNFEVLYHSTTTFGQHVTHFDAIHQTCTAASDHAISSAVHTQTLQYCSELALYCIS
jgi:hypothetical protein